MFVFQVATPFSTGTGIHLPQHGLIVTNEHVVRDSASVVVGREGVAEQLAPVVYLDPYYDLAFLRIDVGGAPQPIVLAAGRPARGEVVKSIGQHFGEHRREATGEVTEENHLRHGINFSSTTRCRAAPRAGAASTPNPASSSA